MQSPDYFEIFIRPLEKSGIRYLVTGSAASIIYGDPRLTHDIDLVVHMREKEVLHLIEAFPEEHFYCPPEEVIRIELKREVNAHFNLIHHDTGLKADIYPDRPDEFYAWAFQNRRQLEVVPGLKVWVAPPEYVIVRKLEYYREGKSEKHLKDIASMFLVSGSEIDKVFLEKQVRDLGLLEFLKKVEPFDS